MVWEDGHLKTIEKPDCCPRFQNYTMYKKYLESVARNIGMNASSKARSYQIDMLTGLSTGYDSVATSIISKYAGCNKAASIENSSSFWRGADSGVHIAKRIGIDCDVVKHDKKNIIMRYLPGLLPVIQEAEICNYSTIPNHCVCFSVGTMEIPFGINKNRD